MWSMVPGDPVQAMKRTVFALAAILLTAACSKEPVTIPEETNPTTRVMSFTASLESASRAFDDEHPGSFKWEANDAIAVPFLSNGDVVYLSFTTDGSGEFTHTFSEGDNYELAVGRNAYYPYSAVTGTDQVNLDGTVIPLVAQVGSDQTLAFKHLAAFMDLTFTGVPETVTQLKVTGVRSGAYSVDYNEGNPSLTAVGTGTDFYSIPVTGEGTFHATVSFAPGSYNTLSFSLLTANGTVAYSKSTSQTLARKKFYAMPALAYTAATKIFVTTSSTSHYWDRTDVQMIRTGESTYELWMNCDGQTTISVYDEYNLGAPVWTGSVNDGNLYKISWNSATNTGSVDYVSATVNHPWRNEYFDNLGLYGNFSGQWQEMQLTFSGNHSWSKEITVASSGTYSFKLNVYDTGWNDEWGYYSGDGNSVNPGSNGYGVAVCNGEGRNTQNMTVYLTAGTYQFYANSIQPTYSDRPLRVMFVKQ